MVPLLMLSSITGVTGSEALAEESPLSQAGEIVITATRTPNTVSNLPMAVEVINREEIEESGALNLIDLLAETADVNALESMSGRLGIARLRGLDSRLTLVLLDGNRLPSGSLGRVDLREIPAGMVERIEIVRGSSSALYGSDAVGGIINIITRKPTHETHGGLSLSGGESRYGEAGTVETDGWLSGTSGRLGYAIAGSWYDRDRYDRNTVDLATDGDDRIIGSGSVALTYALKPGLKFTGGVVCADNSLDGIRTQGTTNSNRNVESDRLLVHVRAEIRTGDESSLSLQLSRSTYDWKSDMDYFSGSPTIRTTDNVAQNKRTRTETIANYSTLTNVSQDADQIDARWSGALWTNHRLTGGTEYRTEKREDYSNTISQVVTTVTKISDGVVISGPMTQYTSLLSTGSHEAHNLGLFAQDEFRLLEPLSFIAGVRYDDHSGFGSGISPKIATLLRLSDSMKLRASYGEGFRAPSLYELYTGSLQTRTRIELANPDLEAETSKSWEVGADFAWKGVSSGVTAFRNEVKHMISLELYDDSTTPDSYKYMNVSEAMTRGIEISTSLKLPAGFSLSEQITLLDSEKTGTEEHLNYVADMVNVFRINYTNERIGLKGMIKVISMGTQYVSATDKVKGYSLVNCYLAKKATKTVELFAGADNIFNDDANSAYGNNEGAGATGTYYYGGINYRF
ncbi:MAG: TonB-dependent receptor [Chlorobiaceae bacterium]|nr:TonB-dependent receptor [Chlorobiaceae bacterium]